MPSGNWWNHRSLQVPLMTHQRNCCHLLENVRKRGALLRNMQLWLKSLACPTTKQWWTSCGTRAHAQHGMKTIWNNFLRYHLGYSWYIPLASSYYWIDLINKADIFLVFTQVTHERRREEIVSLEAEGTKRMVHTCLEKCPVLGEEKYLLQEVAKMFNTEASQLKAAASQTLKTVESMSKLSTYEVWYI